MEVAPTIKAAAARALQVHAEDEMRTHSKHTLERIFTTLSAGGSETGPSAHQKPVRERGDNPSGNEERKAGSVGEG